MRQPNMAYRGVPARGYPIGPDNRRRPGRTGFSPFSRSTRFPFTSTASPPAPLAIRKAPSASVESIQPRPPQPCAVGRPKGRRRKNRRQSHNFFLAPAAPIERNLPREPTRARRRSGLPPGAWSDAAEVAQPHRARNLPATESDRGAGDRGAERATRHAALPSARAGEGGGGTGAGHHRLQPDPTVACPPSAAGRSVEGPTASVGRLEAVKKLQFIKLPPPAALA